MAPLEYTRIVLNERPVAGVTPTTFRRETHPFSSLRPGNGQVLIQVTWISLDPAMRGWLRDVRSYMPPVQIGEVMRAQGLGVVIGVGIGSKFKVGDIVRCTSGEQKSVGIGANMHRYITGRLAGIYRFERQSRRKDYV
jgi:NADPH-dependent curcumin reductase CurA